MRVIPAEFFAAASSECRDVFIDGHLYACISLSQAVAEGLTRYIADIHRLDARNDPRKRVERQLARADHESYRGRRRRGASGREEEQMTDVRFGRFLVRVTACHVATYFVCGAIAYYAFDYAGAFTSPDISCYLRPISSKWIPLGPSLNVVRGLIFALALFPFRRVFLEERYGWLKLWGLLLGLCILSTAGPAPGSVEGLIYTQMPWTAQLLGLREVVAQTLAFSYLLVAWHHRPGRAWGIVMGAIMVLVVLASIGGTLAAQPPAR